MTTHPKMILILALLANIAGTKSIQHLVFTFQAIIDRFIRCSEKNIIHPMSEETRNKLKKQVQIADLTQSGCAC